MSTEEKIFGVDFGSSDETVICIGTRLPNGNIRMDDIASSAEAGFAEIYDRMMPSLNRIAELDRQAQAAAIEAVYGDERLLRAAAASKDESEG